MAEEVKDETVRVKLTDSREENPADPELHAIPAERYGELVPVLPLKRVVAYSEDGGPIYADDVQDDDDSQPELTDEELKAQEEAAAKEAEKARKKAEKEAKKAPKDAE